MRMNVENITEAELAALPDAQRIVLQAYIRLGGYEKVADEGLIPIGTVKSRINRGRCKIAAARAANLDPVGP